MRIKNADIIIAHASYVRQSLLRRYNRTRGFCFDSSCALGARLEREGFQPKMAEGFIALPENRRGNHYWIEINGKILDVTADQFNPDLPDVDHFPEIVYSTYRVWKPYKKLSSLEVMIPQWSEWAMSVIEGVNEY